MKETGIKEKQDEEVRMSKFSTWCGNTQSFKTTAIKKAEGALATLAADIEKAGSDAAAAGKAIEGLDADIATYEADKKDDLENKEAEERHTFDMLAQELTDQIEGAVR